MGFIEDRRFRRYGAACFFFDKYGGIGELAIVTHVALVRQVHSDIVVRWHPSEVQEADGVYTHLPGVFVAVKVADCVPIVILDTGSRIICSVHAGWRGSAKGIVKKAVAKLVEEGASKEGMIVSFGPHICGGCYEVGGEVAELFQSECIRKSGDSLFLDLACVNRKQLLECGIPPKNIENVGVCTYEDRRFFSYRRDGVCGRNVGGGVILG